MTPDDLRERMRKNHAAGLRPVKVRIYAGDEQPKDLMIPGGKRTRWAAVAERIFTLVPTWHKVEWCDKQGGILDFVERDVGTAVGFAGELGEIAETVAGAAGVNLGQQLAGFGGLLQLVSHLVDRMRAGDRQLLAEVCKTATDTMKVYAGRVEAMEKSLDKQIQLSFHLARQQARYAVAAVAGGEGVEPSGSMSDDALERLMDLFDKWMKGGRPPGPHGPANGTPHS